MLKSGLSTIALVVLAVSQPGGAQPVPQVGAPPIPSPSAPSMRGDLPPIGTPETVGSDAARQSTTAVSGDQAPMATAKSDPKHGDQLPREWMQPAYHIAQPRRYKLREPAPGFGWSRYGDNAVLTDQWGRIYAAEKSVVWTRKAKPSRDGGTYSLHWNDARPLNAALAPLPYEEVTTTRTIYDPPRRVAVTRYEYVKVPVRRVGKSHKYAPRRAVRRARRIVR